MVVLLCSGVVMDVFAAVALYCYGALCGNIVWLLCFHSVLVDVLSHSVVVLCCVSVVWWWMDCHTECDCTVVVFLWCGGCVVT